MKWVPDALYGQGKHDKGMGNHRIVLFNKQVYKQGDAINKS